MKHTISLLVWLSVLVICSPGNAQTNSRSSTDSKNLPVPPQKQQADMVLPYFWHGGGETLTRDCKWLAKADLDHMVFKGPTDEMSGAFACIGFIAGIVDAETMKGVVQQKLFCVPDAATGGQLAKVIAKYGDDHPEKLHEPGVWFAFAALEAAFPCE